MELRQTAPGWVMWAGAVPLTEHGARALDCELVGSTSSGSRFYSSDVANIVRRVSESAADKKRVRDLVAAP